MFAVPALATGTATGLGPSIQILADGVQVASLTCELGGGLICGEGGIATIVTGLLPIITPGLDIITLEPSTTLNPDPQIVYSSTITDIGAPSTFNFVFSQSIVATPAPGLADHTLSSNTTDGSTNGVTATAAAAPGIIPVDSDGIPEIAKYTLSIDGGTTFVNAGYDVGPSFVAPTGSTSQGPYLAGGAGPLGAGSYNFMRVDVNVTLSGGGDRYAFNGRASIEQDVNVPEPGTGALLGIGLLGIALRSRRGSR